MDKPKNTKTLKSCFDEIDIALNLASGGESFDKAVDVARSVMQLLGFESESIKLEFLRGIKKLENQTNDSWTKKAPGFTDRKAAYKLSDKNEKNIDFKIYWSKKPNKRVISNLVALTPNFEDEDVINSNDNVGIDFVIPDKADRLIIVLSNNYKIRTLELHRSLTNTQKTIFEKWHDLSDFDNKSQFHKLLWDSFDIHPLNKEFYKSISTFFNEQVQHLVSKKILDEEHAKQFTTRLIGRLIFCWFLRKKDLIASGFEYFETDNYDAIQYYRLKLERLFFEVLNTPISDRDPLDQRLVKQLKLLTEKKQQNSLFEIDQQTPFLNGGLFDPKESDLYGKDELSFPSDYFKRFIKDFLELYNFTTDESTSDFQQVAIDPEMLGRIFENLLAEQLEGETGEQARRAKGTFYTPREIVSYMCRESLRQYLSSKLNEDQRKEHLLFLLLDKREHDFDYKNDSADLKPYKTTLIDALDDLKLIDLACGSGAFPIGMLQIILSTYVRLDRRFDSFKTKEKIIYENIYGVDIEPTAIEIARLRTWLSLIVDVELKHQTFNRGIDPLPNLDFKFVCANSLIPLASNDQQSLFDDQEFEKTIQSIREEYFNTNSLKRKRQLQNEFETLIGDNLLSLNNGMSERQKQLRSYHPFDSDNVSQFFDSHFMFGIDGFDIVIGNPPYDVYQGDKKDQIKKILNYPIYEIAKGRKLNAYKVFLARSAELSKNDGILCQIFQNSFLCDDSATKLRDYFLNHQRILCIDSFPERDDKRKRVFESAKMSVCILLSIKSQLDNYTFGVNFWDDREKLTGTKVNFTNAEITQINPLKFLIPRISDAEKDIFLKFYDHDKNIMLGSFADCIEGELNMTFHKKYFSDNLTYPKIIKGAQIQRFHITDNPSQGKVEYVNVSEYLKDNTSAKSQHHLLHRIGMQGITGANDKIRLVMAMIQPNMFCANSCNYILVHDDSKNKYSNELILAFLCSKFLNWIFRQTSTNSNVNCYEIKTLMFPKDIPASIKEKIEKIVIEILSKKHDHSSDTVKLENELDSIIFNLYKLKENEISHVSAFYK